MVVFIISVILIVIVLITILIIKSTTKLKLTNFVINDYDDLKEIIMLIKNKEYTKIFEHLDFLLTLELCIFKKLPIFKFRVSDEEIAKFLKKQIEKHKLKKEEKDKDDKKQIDEKLPDINLESLNLLMNVGTNNAGITALSSSIVSILISIVLPSFINKINLNKFYYEINPVYLDKPFFNINASATISFSTIDLLSLIK